MKRLVVLLFGLVGAALFMSAANSGDRVLRDSIFHVYRSMPADTTRTVFAKEAAMGHVKESLGLGLDFWALSAPRAWQPPAFPSQGGLHRAAA